MKKMAWWLLSYYRIKNFLVFGLIKEPRPNFSKEPVEICTTNIKNLGDNKDNFRNEPIFTNINPIKAKEQKWLHNFYEYSFLAGMEFARRFPNHKYSKNMRKHYPYTNKQILAIAKGKQPFYINQRGKMLEFTNIPIADVHLKDPIAIFILVIAALLYIFAYIYLFLMK